MLSRHLSGLEQILDEILRKSFEKLPLHRVLVRGLYHVVCMALVRQSMSAGHPQLTTGIPVGKPAGMETRGSELPVMTSLPRSGF